MVAKKNVKRIPLKETKKTSKEVPIVQANQRVQKENPRRNPVAAQIKPKEAQLKKYYTVEEDAIIIKAFEEKQGNQTIASVIKQLCKKIEKTEESLKNRLKRFIRKFTPQDQKLIIQHSKVHPTHYVQITRDQDDNVKVKGIVPNAPSIVNLGKAFFKKSKKIVKKTKKPVKHESVEDINWLLTKINNQDQQFRVYNQIYLLNAILQYMISQGQISTLKAKSVLEQIEGDMNLSELIAKLKE